MPEERYADEPRGTATPAELFEREWAATLIDRVLEQRRLEFATSGRLELFDALEPHLWGDEVSTPHAVLAVCPAPGVRAQSLTQEILLLPGWNGV